MTLAAFVQSKLCISKERYDALNNEMDTFCIPLEHIDRELYSKMWSLVEEWCSIHKVNPFAPENEYMIWVECWDKFKF